MRRRAATVPWQSPGAGKRRPRSPARPSSRTPGTARDRPLGSYLSSVLTRKRLDLDRLKITKNGVDTACPALTHLAVGWEAGADVETLVIPGGVPIIPLLALGVVGPSDGQRWTR